MDQTITPTSSGPKPFANPSPGTKLPGESTASSAEHEHESADDLRDEIGAGLSDRRRGGEDGELALRIGRRFPVRQIREPHDDAAEESADDLRGDVHRHLRPREFADGRERDRDRGIEMRAADAVHAVDGDRDGERPAGGDDDPAGVLALGAVEHDVGDDAVAEHDEDRGAEQLGEEEGTWRSGEGCGGSLHRILRCHRVLAT